MTVRRLDPDTDDIVTSGVQFLTGIEEIAQTIKTNLRLFLGEYFRDITKGTPWFQSILGKGGTLTSKDASVKRVIAQTNGVSRLLEFTGDYDIETREYSITCQVLTTFGELTLTTEGVI